MVVPPKVGWRYFNFDFNQSYRKFKLYIVVNGKTNIALIWKTAYLGAKRAQIWDSGQLAYTYDAHCSVQSL